MTDETQMLYIKGTKTSYRCTCGANVFTKTSEHIWRCNGCRALHSDLFIKISHYLATQTVIDPIAAIHITQDIMKLIEEEYKEV